MAQLESANSQQLSSALSQQLASSSSLQLSWTFSQLSEPPGIPLAGCPSLYEQLVTGRNTDYTLHAYGRVYRLHRVILCASGSNLGDVYGEDHNQESILPQDAQTRFTQEAFEFVLDYIYRRPGQHLEFPFVLQIWDAAAFLNVTELVSYCFKFVQEHLTLSTWLPIHLWSSCGDHRKEIQHHCQRLLVASMSSKWNFWAPFIQEKHDDGTYLIPLETLVRIFDKGAILASDEYDRYQLALKVAALRGDEEARKAMFVGIHWAMLTDEQLDQVLAAGYDEQVNKALFGRWIVTRALAGPHKDESLQRIKEGKLKESPLPPSLVRLRLNMTASGLEENANPADHIVTVEVNLFGTDWVVTLRGAARNVVKLYLQRGFKVADGYDVREKMLVLSALRVYIWKTTSNRLIEVGDENDLDRALHRIGAGQQIERASARLDGLSKDDMIVVGFAFGPKIMRRI